MVDCPRRAISRPLSVVGKTFSECPISDVLVASENGIQVNDLHCIYCGTCKIACPKDDAIEIIRTNVRHSKIHSAAWNKALEKLASTSTLSKEIRKRNAEKLKKAFLKRFPPEDLD